MTTKSSRFTSDLSLAFFFCSLSLLCGAVNGKAVLSALICIFVSCVYVVCCVYVPFLLYLATCTLLADWRFPGSFSGGPKERHATTPGGGGQLWRWPAATASAPAITATLSPRDYADLSGRRTAHLIRPRRMRWLEGGADGSNVHVTAAGVFPLTPLWGRRQLSRASPVVKAHPSGDGRGGNGRGGDELLGAVRPFGSWGSARGKGVATWTGLTGCALTRASLHAAVVRGRRPVVAATPLVVSAAGGAACGALPGGIQWHCGVDISAAPPPRWGPTRPVGLEGEGDGA